LEINLWELLPHDPENLFAGLPPILLHVSDESFAFLLARADRPAGTARKSLQPASVLIRATRLLLALPFVAITRYSVLFNGI